MDNLQNLMSELNSSYAEFDAKQNKKNSAKVRKYLMDIKKHAGEMRKTILVQSKEPLVRPTEEQLNSQRLVRPTPQQLNPEILVRPTPEEVNRNDPVEKKKKENKRKLDKVNKKTTVKFN
jgi:hypothetical protein